MIAPGVRVARGPDWIWQNQGMYLTLDYLNYPWNIKQQNFRCEIDWLKNHNERVVTYQCKLSED